MEFEVKEMKAKNENYIKIRSFKTHKENPFLLEVKKHLEKGEKIRLFSTKNQAIVDLDTGEIDNKSSIVIHKKESVDKAQFAKIYLSSLRAFFSLSNTAIRVLAYIMTIVEKDRDFIYFSVEDCMEYTNYNSEKTIFKGLGELLDNDFIARSDKSYKFFINPCIFFNGDRLFLIKEYEKKQKEKEQENENENENDRESI